MHYGRFVGRVGMLAVALGIGVTAPAVALAEPTDDGTADASVDSTGTPEPRGAQTSDTSAAGTSSSSSSSDDADADVSDNLGDEDGSSATTSEVSAGDAPSVVVSSSGGAHSAGDSSTDGESAALGPDADEISPPADEAPDVSDAPLAGSNRHPTIDTTAARSTAPESSFPSTPPESAGSTTTVVSSARQDESPALRSAPEPAPAVAVVSAPEPASVAPPAPVQAVPAPPTTQLQTALSAALGTLPGAPEVPVGSPVFETMVAAYRRTEAQQDAEPTAPPALVTTAQTTPSGGGATVGFAVGNDWGSGYVATVTVTAGADALDGWTVEFDSPDQITNLWSGQIADHTAGHYVITNADWNGTVAAGQAVTFGYQASTAGTTAQATNFTLNGDAAGGTPEPAPQPAISVADTTAPEDDGALNFTVTLSQASTDTVTVGYTTTDGTATAGTDYVAAAGTLTFDPGQTTQQLTVDVIDDTAVEANETLTVTLSDPTGATLANGAATGTVIDDDTVQTQPQEAFFAPFVDMGAYPVPDLLAISEQYGISFLNLGFMQVDSNGKLAWAGLSALEPNSGNVQAQAINDSIAQFQAAGGEVAVSLGGVAGTTIAQSYAAQGLDARALADAYQSVIDAYHLDRIDFDIEGAAVADPASVALRSQALALVQQDNPDLKIWYTLPVLPSGLTSTGLGVVESALGAGVTLDGVNVMAMDYGESAAPTTGSNAQTMGAYAIESAESTHEQLSSLYADYNRQFGWDQLGVTPMIGVNDITSEVFTLDDADALVAFANSTGLGMLSMWSVNRDNPGTLGQSTNSASGLDAAAGAFSDIFNDFGVTNDVNYGGGTDTGGGPVDGGTTTVISWQWGTDTVLQFNPAADKLDFGWFRPDEFDVAEQNGSTEIAVVGNRQTYTLDGITLSQLQIANIVALDSNTLNKWQDILDNASSPAPSPGLSIADATITEGDSGTTPITFTVTLSHASTDTVTANYRTVDGTATAGADYAGTSGVLTFTPGTTARRSTSMSWATTSSRPTRRSPSPCQRRREPPWATRSRSAPSSTTTRPPPPVGTPRWASPSVTTGAAATSPPSPSPPDSTPSTAGPSNSTPPTRSPTCGAARSPTTPPATT